MKMRRSEEKFHPDMSTFGTTTTNSRSYLIINLDLGINCGLNGDLRLMAEDGYNSDRD